MKPTGKEWLNGAVFISSGGNTGSVLRPVSEVDWFCGSGSLAQNHMQTFTWAPDLLHGFSSGFCLLKLVTDVQSAGP